MAQMKARRSFRYAGRRLAVGDPFDTKSDRDAVLLEAAGRAMRTAKVEEKEAKVAKRRGRPVKMAAVEPSAATGEPAVAPYDSGVVDLATATPNEFVPGDRFYQRRDMQADDE